MAANRHRYLRGEVIMRKRIGFVSLILMFAFASPVLAQDFCTENSIPTLERQLSDIDSRETQLRIRLEELDEELLSAHIERPLAGIGSTRPEVLREHRRKMLTIERDGLRSQLDVLEQSQASVESEIASAENAWFLRYAQPTPACPQRGQLIALPNIQAGPGLLRRAVFAIVILSFAILGFLRVIGRRMNSWDRV